MHGLVLTNVKIYKAIADEAYQKLVLSMEAGRRPKPDGSSGWIITYVPNQIAFKQAMISIVFTGMWLDALLHLHIVKMFSKSKFKKNKDKTYEEKLVLIGCSDKEMLDCVKRFRKEARNPLVHENAHFDNGEMKTAQDEAVKANKLRGMICEYFKII